jgi:acetyl esterase/lipase
VCPLIEFHSNSQSSSSSSSFIWNTGTDLTSQGCNASGKFAFIFHGYQGHNNTWQQQLASKLLQYRGGCVIVVNYKKYSSDWNFPWVVAYHFPRISNVIKKRLQSLEASGVSPSNIYMYGHSMGARLVIDAGIKFGKGKIGQVDGK